MEAASIAWRPLGRLLVEQGLLTNEELELALVKQQITGKRLGETIVECGFVSRPDLSNALAAQYGIELKTETGFGTGLRAQIQQRHESDRGRVVSLDSVRPAELPVEPIPEPLELEEPAPAEPPLLAQLEEQWAKLAAAEDRLAEREAVLAEVTAERDRRRDQVVRFLERVRWRDEELARYSEELNRLAEAAAREVVDQSVLAAAEERLAGLERELQAVAAERNRRRAQVFRFVQRVQRRDDELAQRREELNRLGEAADNQVVQQRNVLAAAEERLEALERELGTLAGDRNRRRAQVLRFVQRVRRRDEEISWRGEELIRLGDAADGEVARHRDMLAAAEERLARLERELGALAAERDRRRAQVFRFVRRVRRRDDALARHRAELHGLGELADGLREQVERLSGDVRGCDAEIARLRQQNAHRREQAARLAVRLRELRSVPEPTPVVVPVDPAGHLVFVQLAGGYSLVEREGPPPPRNTPLELPELCEETLVVAGLRRSPFPGDTRPCVVVELT